MCFAPLNRFAPHDDGRPGGDTKIDRTTKNGRKWAIDRRYRRARPAATTNAARCRWSFNVEQIPVNSELRVVARAVLHFFASLTIFSQNPIHPETHPGTWSNRLTRQTKNIRLFLVEDNRLLREGISSLLNEHADMRVVASLGTSDNLLQKIQSLKPHVVLLDLGLRSQNSLELVKAVKARFSATKVIMMDLIPTEADVLEYIHAGVSGFILKDATLVDFLRTIRSVAQGTKVLPSLLTSSLFSQIVDHAVNAGNRASSKLMESVRMTRRERQVIELISDGMTNKEIAQKLHLSTYTVKSHVHNILEKLTLHTRVQIARYAHESGAFQAVADTISLIEE